MALALALPFTLSFFSTSAVADAGAALVLKRAIEQMKKRPSGVGWVCLDMGAHDIFEVIYNENSFDDRLFIKMDRYNHCEPEDTKILLEKYPCLEPAMRWAAATAERNRQEFLKDHYQIVAMVWNPEATHYDDSWKGWLYEQVSSLSISQARAQELDDHGCPMRLRLELRSDGQVLQSFDAP
jgi:hypothetical protein